MLCVTVLLSTPNGAVEDGDRLPRDFPSRHPGRVGPILPQALHPAPFRYRRQWVASHTSYLVLQLMMLATFAWNNNKDPTVVGAGARSFLFLDTYVCTWNFS